MFSSHIIDGTLQITAIQGDNFQYVIELLEGKHALQLPVMVLVNNQYIANTGMDFEQYVNKILEYGVATLYLRAPRTLSDAFKLNVFEALLGQSTY